MKAKNVFAGIPADLSLESFETLLRTDQFRLERIVSHGQATPAGEWLNQDRDEWVILLSGRAGLRFDGESEVLLLEPGDYVWIRAHQPHRVEWTAPHEATVWLALHFS